MVPGDATDSSRRWTPGHGLDAVGVPEDEHPVPFFNLIGISQRKFGNQTFGKCGKEIGIDPDQSTVLLAIKVLTECLTTKHRPVVKVDLHRKTRSSTNVPGGQNEPLREVDDRP